MKRELFNKWIEALESGQYRQCNGALCVDQTDGTRAHCCLGVLLDVAGIKSVNVGADGVHIYESKGGYERAFLPVELCTEWDMDNGGNARDNLPSLTNLNDSVKMPFADIAAHLREHGDKYVTLEN